MPKHPGSFLTFENAISILEVALTYQSLVRRGLSSMTKSYLVTLSSVMCSLALGFYAGALWHKRHRMRYEDQVGSNLVQTDSLGRLTWYPGKTEIVCPKQTEKTAVLLLIGQSNAANHQGQKYVSKSNRVLNFANGKCYIASSPLLGAEGQMGESWTLLANRLVESGDFSQVILVPAGVGETAVMRWKPGADANAGLMQTLHRLAATYKVTHTLWHQGESDFRLGTSTSNYMEALNGVIKSIAAVGVKAPFFVSVASFEQRYANWSVENPVADAQRMIVDNRAILSGPDTDVLVTPLDRFDGTHFSASGQEKFVGRWIDILEAYQKDARR